jgi:hypothetical protein
LRQQSRDERLTDAALALQDALGAAAPLAAGAVDFFSAMFISPKKLGRG